MRPQVWLFYPFPAYDTSFRNFFAIEENNFFTPAAFLVDIMVLNTNMPMNNFPEMKLCIFISILRHAPLPVLEVQKALKDCDWIDIKLLQ